MSNKFNLLLLSLCLLPYPAHANTQFNNIHSVISYNELKSGQKAFQQNLDVIQLWEDLDGLPLGSSASNLSHQACTQKMSQIDGLVKKYFYSIELQKLALDCRNLLEDDALASHHENHLINLSKLVTESGTGKTLESAFWVTDMGSAYEFISMAGMEVVDGKFKIHDKQLYLAVLVKTEKIFAEFRYFKLNQFYKKINQNVTSSLSEEELKAFQVINMVLQSELENNEGLLSLATANLTEAQLLLASLLVEKSKRFPTLYQEAMVMYRLAADNESVIGKHQFAYRIFIDKLEKLYPRGHEMIADALSARYLPALTLAAIVREQKLGIGKERKTVKEIISLLNEQGEPGEYEYLIGSHLSHNKIWNNPKLAKKYLTKAIDKNNPKAMILYGLMHQRGNGVTQNHKKAHQWFLKANQYDETGEALMYIGLNQVEAWGTKRDINGAIESFGLAAKKGNTSAHFLAGLLLSEKVYGHVDHQKAHQYFKSGHELHHPRASIYLAVSYFHGLGTTKNHQRAFDILSQLESENNGTKELYLAAAHYHGLGTTQDKTKGVRIYRELINNRKFYELSRNHLILANLNLRLSYTGDHEMVVPYDGLVQDITNQTKNKNAEAIFKLGYLNYMTYEADMTRANGVSLLQEAADLGNPHAHFQLSAFYRWEKDQEKRKHHAQKAREAKEPMSIYDEANTIIESNPKRAVQLIESAADAGLIYAINKLAELYEEGKIVTRDLAQAVAYRKKAFFHGDDMALKHVIQMYQNKKIDQQQLGDNLLLFEAQTKKYNDPHMMRLLTEFYLDESLSEHDIEKSVEWFIRAFDAGDKEAIIELGKRYLYGIDLNQDFELAQFFFTNAAAKRTFTWADLIDEPGSFWVAIMFQKGLGVEKNEALAKQLYANNFNKSRKKEAKNNHAVLTCLDKSAHKKEKKESFKTIKELSEKSRTALFNLGWMYEHGLCTKQNLGAAKKTYQKAADKNSPHALYRLHQLHASGTLFEKDAAKSDSYLTRSIEASEKVKYHNLISTFLDLPYIQNLKLVLPDE